MGVRVGASKRASLMLVALLNLAQVNVLTHAVSRWADYWAVNRSSIFVFTVINTTITTGSEFFSRSIAPSLSENPEANRFIVRDENGHRHIHHQSLVSIFMTFFASLLGGPVFFFLRRKQRFIFFVSFGVFNSLLSQALSCVASRAMPDIVVHRLMFDIIYNGTFKFFMFEVGRRPILNLRKNRSVARVGMLRISQDFLSTYFRVILLNFLKFRG